MNGLAQITRLRYSFSRIERNSSGFAGENRWVGFFLKNCSGFPHAVVREWDEGNPLCFQRFRKVVWKSLALKKRNPQSIK